MQYKDLLPCPFCGAKPAVGSLGGDGENWSIYCQRCKIACIENDINETLEDIKKQWNQRPTEYFICFEDQGGKNGTVPDMAYHLKQQHLIRIKKQITNYDVEQLAMAIGRTRKYLRVVGSWGPEEDGLPPVLEYEDLNL